VCSQSRDNIRTNYSSPRTAGLLEKQIVDKQEFSAVLWTSKVHYRAHKSPSLVAILSHIIRVCALNPYCFISIFYSHLSLDLQTCPFLRSGFHTKILRAFFVSCTCCMTHYYHISWFDRTNLVTSTNFEAPRYAFRRLVRRIYFLCLQGRCASKHLPDYTALHLREEYSP
jgi:hypothetical protein